MSHVPATVALLLLAASCGDGDGRGGGGGTPLTEGTAHLEFAGGIPETHDLPLDDVDASPVYEPPSGEMDLEWNYPTDQDPPEGGEGSLHITGTVFTGTRPTSDDLMISLETALDSFFSSDGECEITIARADPGSLEGNLSCPRLRSDPGEPLVAVTGTFTAGG
jgi:hypothetical protein